MLPQQYCLRWKYHHSNLQTMFSQLLERGCFCDVTLACDGQTLKAHRVVLSACSTYFDSILTNCNSEKDPIIILKDVKFMDIKYLVEFMYKGEINVEHNNLASLLKTAEELRIKGLAEVSWRDDENEDGSENNDSNNNNVTEASNGGSYQQPPTTSNSNLVTNGKIEIPFLTPMTSPKDLSAALASRKKRGRPPLDDPSNNFPKGPKFPHLEHFYDNEGSNEGGKDCGSSGSSSIYDLSSSATQATSLVNNSNLSTTAQQTAALNHRMMLEEASNNQQKIDEKHLHNENVTKKHLKSPFSSSNLVTVMMDDHKSHEPDEYPFYLTQQQQQFHHLNRRDAIAAIAAAENGHHTHKNMDYDEDLTNQKVIPKVERAETPTNELEEEDEAILCSPAEHLQSIFLTDEERKQWNDVIRMSDYLTKGRRPQFWEEPFTKRVLDAIKNKNLEMKKAAKLLGVSYGTLYGRYRETYGCLKHPYRGPPGTYAMISRMRDMYDTKLEDGNDILNLIQRNRLSMLQNEEMNNGTNQMDMMMHEDAMMEQMSKGFPRKMINNLEMANLLKQVQQNSQHLHSKMSSPSSTHSISPPRQTTTPNSMKSTSQSLMLTPVALPPLPPSTSSSIDSANKLNS